MTSSRSEKKSFNPEETQMCGRVFFLVVDVKEVSMLSYFRSD